MIKRYTHSKKKKMDEFWSQAIQLIQLIIISIGNTTLVISINLESLKETTVKTVRDHRISDGCLKFLSQILSFS